LCNFGVRLYKTFRCWLTALEPFLVSDPDQQLEHSRGSRQHTITLEDVRKEEDIGKMLEL